MDILTVFNQIVTVVLKGTGVITLVLLNVLIAKLTYIIAVSIAMGGY